MNYQPNLCIFNSGSFTCKQIYEVIMKLDFGKIRYVERDSGGYVYVSMSYWNTRLTTATRMKLQEGKPLLLYYSDTKYWKVYSYEHRFKEEELRRERKEKASAFRRELKEKAATFRRELKEKVVEFQRQQKLKTDEALKNVNPYVLDYKNAMEVYPKLVEKNLNIFKKLKQKNNK